MTFLGYRSVLNLMGEYIPIKKSMEPNSKLKPRLLDLRSFLGGFLGSSTFCLRRKKHGDFSDTH